MRINGTLRQRQLGRELRRLREEARLTLEEAAPKLDWSTSKLGRIETAQQSVDVHGVRSMLDLYDVGGDRWTEIIDLVREARRKDRWRSYGRSGQGYLKLETDATVVHNYQLAYVPGLLQTEDYMRTLFQRSWRCHSEAEINLNVRARLFRQQRLTKDRTLELVTIVDESVLHRPVGGVEVMRAQLRQIVACAALSSVCFQVLPYSLGEHAGMDGSFTVLGFDDPDEPEIAYIENIAIALHLEKETEVHVCRLAFERLRAEALSPSDSMAFVEQLAAAL